MANERIKAAMIQSIRKNKAKTIVVDGKYFKVSIETENIRYTYTNDGKSYDVFTKDISCDEDSSDSGCVTDSDEDSDSDTEHGSESLSDTVSSEVQEDLETLLERLIPPLERNNSIISITLQNLNNDQLTKFNNIFRHKSLQSLTLDDFTLSDSFELEIRNALSNSRSTLSALVLKNVECIDIINDIGYTAIETLEVEFSESERKSCYTILSNVLPSCPRISEIGIVCDYEEKDNDEELDEAIQNLFKSMLSCRHLKSFDDDYLTDYYSEAYGVVNKYLEEEQELQARQLKGLLQTSHLVMVAPSAYTAEFTEDNPLRRNQLTTFSSAMKNVEGAIHISFKDVCVTETTTRQKQFKRLFGKKITSLEISDFECSEIPINRCVNLTSLSMATYLDFSSSLPQHIINLALTGGCLTSQGALTIVRNLNQLRVLNLRDNEIQGEDAEFKELIKSVAHKPIVEVRLDGNKLKEIGARCLSHKFKKHLTLAFLSLMDCGLNDEAFKYLMALASAGYPQFRVMKLSDNDFSMKVVKSEYKKLKAVADKRPVPEITCGKLTEKFTCLYKKQQSLSESEEVEYLTKRITRLRVLHRSYLEYYIEKALFTSNTNYYSLMCEILPAFGISVDKKLIKTNSKKLLGHIRRIEGFDKGSCSEVDLENFDSIDQFLDAYLVAIFLLIIKLSKNEHHIPGDLNSGDLRKILVKEFLQAYNARQVYLMMEEINNSQGALYSELADSIIRIIKSMKPDESISIPTGDSEKEIGHTIYVHFLIKTDSTLWIRVDNCGALAEAHEGYEENQVRPLYVGKIDLKDSDDGVTLKNYLIAIFKCNFEPRKKAAKSIYNSQLIPPTKREQKNLFVPRRSMQTTNNCAFESYDIGVEIRISNDASYRWLKTSLSTVLDTLILDRTALNRAVDEYEQNSPRR